MNSVSNATFLLFNDDVLSLRGNQLVKSNFQERIKRFFSSAYDKAEIQKISSFVQEKLLSVTDESKSEYQTLADALIIRYAKDWRGSEIVKLLDRTSVRYRTQTIFFHHANQASLNKWISHGFSLDIYKKHPEFCSFLEISGLSSQMKVTRDAPIEIDGEPAIFVDGNMTKWSEMKDRFQAVYSKSYKEKFIIDNDVEVYTFLDNGKGLQKHHPYITENTPTSTLNDEEYTKVLAKAREFVRLGEEGVTTEEKNKLSEERTFVIQIVSSYIDGKDSNFHELLLKPQHPYLRLIVGEDDQSCLNTPSLSAICKFKKGDVYEVGFEKGRFFGMQEGQFRFPDIWEYKQCNEKVVTNVPVTKEEAAEFISYTSRYHRSSVRLGNSIGFHWTKQNCSTYASQALASANIRAPIQINLSDLFSRISPDWFANIQTLASAAWTKGHQFLHWTFNALPSSVKEKGYFIVKRVADLVLPLFEAMIAFFLIPTDVAFGGAYIQEGLAFDDAKNVNNGIIGSLADKKRWFKLSNYQINLPGILQEWQRKQASTVIYKRPLHLAIVPI